jgi:hypothetical protein
MIFADAGLASKDRVELAKQAYEMALNGSREIASIAAKAGETFSPSPSLLEGQRQ